MTHKLKPLVLECIVDDLSPDDHYECQMFEDVHELVLKLAVVSRQLRLSHVLLLLCEVMFEGEVPPQWLSQL